MRTDVVEEVEVSIEKKSKPVAKKKGKVGRPSKPKKEKLKQIPGGFTKEEVERIEKVIAANNFTSMAHFMRTAGLGLLEELENK